MDLSLMRALHGKVDLQVVLEVAPHSLRSTAFDAPYQPQRNGILPATGYPGMAGWDAYIPLDRIHVWNQTRSRVLSTAYLRCATELRQLVARLSPDLIHINNLPSGGLSLLAKPLAPMAITIHDPLPHLGEETRQLRLWRELYFSRIKDVILFNRNQSNAFLKRYARHRLRVHHSRLGPYEYLQDVGTSNPEDTRSPYILFFGRVSRYKGVDILLDAFERISVDYPDIELVVAGKGDYWFDLARYTRNPRIRILNRFIATPELATLIRGSMFVVCPYIEATQSGVVMSSFAFSKPVLATNVGGLPEMIEDGFTGGIVPPSDSGSLAAMMASWLATPSLPAEFSQNILTSHHADGPRGWSRIGDELLETYVSILNSR